MYDFAVIGGGVVGCAIARELAALDASVVLVEARGDVGDGPSKAGTGVLQTGFDAIADSLEGRLVARGHLLLTDFAERTGIPIERTGAVVVAWTADELAELPRLAEQAARNGYPHTRPLDVREVYSALPALGWGALGGLAVPDESIICPWTTTLALATDAVHRGAELVFDHRVEGVDVAPGHTLLRTNAGAIACRWVVNAAGLGADLIDQFFGHDRFRLRPRRGEFVVFDEFARQLVDTIVLPVPGGSGAGVVVAPTVHGNVLVGPAIGAGDVTNRADTDTTAEGIDALLDRAAAVLPQVVHEEITATFAGLQASSDQPDVTIAVHPEQRYVVAGGIGATGLTAAMAIAEHVVGLLGEAGVDVTARQGLPAAPTMANLGGAGRRTHSDSGSIALDPSYGDLVCFCERVSAGDIRDAFESAVPPRDVDGLRRRTRAMNGRCQGFYCAAEIARRVTERGRES